MNKFFCRNLLFVAATAILASCATDLAEEQIFVEHGCDDLVVVGRGKSIKFTDLSTSDDLFRGVFQMEIRIEHILFGSESNPVITALRYGYASLRDDLDFVFVLSENENGHIVKDADIWNSRSTVILESNCD